MADPNINPNLLSVPSAGASTVVSQNLKRVSGMLLTMQESAAAAEAGVALLSPGIPPVAFGAGGPM